MTGVPPAPPESAGAEGDAQVDLTPRLGANLRRVRTRQGLSLDRLAERSGVSRAMLSQIELGRSTPSVNVLARVVRALRVPTRPCSTPRPVARPSSSAPAAPRTHPRRAATSAARSARPLRLVFEELTLGPGVVVELEAPTRPTARSLAVWRGAVVAEVDGEPIALGDGDALLVDGTATTRLRAEAASTVYVVTSSS